MKISDIPVKETVSPSEISSSFMLGMKNVYPDDEVPVLELQRFPLTAYLSDIDMKTTENLVTRLRNISSEITDKKHVLENLVSKVNTMTAEKIESANLQPLENTIPYQSITSQLTAKFASPEDLQTSVNNVYSALFTAIEDMMVQVFTTSMYARQYTPIYDQISVTASEYKKNHQME